MASCLGVAVDFVAYRGNKDFKQKLLNSPSVQEVVNDRARAVQKRASSMYYATSYVFHAAKPGRNRCHAYVVTGSRAAMADNAKHMTLKKSMNG